jgi:D-arabinose 1-dehydrogenase-like Zn-dependent alcohol dehydrogenase
MGIGLGRDGGMAEYVTVPARNLVPLGDADPIDAAPLSDAGLTPYHAIKQALPNLAGGGRFALVIGLGGLGQLGVQILTALTGATVIATDMKEDAMAKAEAAGAITVPSGPDQVARIREITGGKGVDAAFDFVGAAGTVKVAMESMAVKGRRTLVRMVVLHQPVRGDAHEHLLGHDRGAPRGCRHVQGWPDHARGRALLTGGRSGGLPEAAGRRALRPRGRRPTRGLTVHRAQARVT